MDKKNTINLEKFTHGRLNTKMFLIQNPNYFGTLKDKIMVNKYKPVLDLSDNQNFYEELGCISYDPVNQKLGVVIKINQSSGYSGTPCIGGSNEYVRFFLDYDHSGTWVDEGIASIGVYDHQFNDDLSYYAEIQLSPTETSCCFNDAVLPRVRAILSWNVPPTPGDPHFPFVWGDIKEANIQIAPSDSIWCEIIKLPGLEFEGKNKKVWEKPSFIENYIPDVGEKLIPQIPKSKIISTHKDLHNMYKDSNHHGRVLFNSINSNKNNYKNDIVHLEKTHPSYDVSKLLSIIMDMDYDTTYEDIQCVSLNRDMNKLHAAVHIKRSSGYLGDLCTTGSSEYVAFYMDFGSGWEYMGTSSVEVHDIPTIVTPDGLWYDVSLGVNLDAHRKAWCQVGEAKVLGILSWNTPPTPNDPNYHATWGDRAECNVEIKPLPAGVSPGDVKPFMELVGGMVVTDIDSSTGLATTTSGSVSLGGAFNSPFFGEIRVVGRVFNAGAGMKYRFWVSSPSASEHILMDNQSIQTDNLGVISSPLTLVPNMDGWLDYVALGNVAIVGDLIGRFYPGQEGMHSIRIEAKDAANNIILGNTANFRIDMRAPIVDIHITTGGGDCADFATGDTISGSYSVIGEHAGTLGISVTPNNGAVVNIDGTGSSSEFYPDGGKSGSYSISTVGVPRCGYNVWIGATDRTIVNSSNVGRYSSLPQGFCLRNPNE